MAITIKAYGQFPLNCMKALLSDMNAGASIKGALLTSSYIFDQDNHTSYASLTNEVSSSGTGYSTGGNALAGCYVSYASRVTTWGITTPYTLTFSTVTISDYQYLVLYDNTPAAAANKKLICCINLGQAYAASASNVVFTFNTSGIVTMTVAA